MYYWYDVLSLSVVAGTTLCRLLWLLMRSCVATAYKMSLANDLNALDKFANSPALAALKKNKKQHANGQTFGVMSFKLNANI